MIFAKIDVTFPRHYRLLDVRQASIRIPLGIQSDSDPSCTEASARIARAAALGVWTAALCYTREHMLDGFCPLSAIRELSTDEVIDELVTQGLLARTEEDGRTGVIISNYAKHNETKSDIERRLKAHRARKRSDGIPRGREPGGGADSVRPPTGRRLESRRIPPSESESESESKGREELPSQAPAPPRPRPAPSGDHHALIAHFVAEFERLKGAKPVIGAKGGAGASKLLEGRTLAEARTIVDRALADPWWLDKNPDLAAIAGSINSFIGRKATGGTSQTQLQPSSPAWKKAEVAK
jgi:hypothetical protein